MSDPEYWTPEPLLAGQTVFLLGGGPSLMDFAIGRLRGRRVMAINSSYLLCPWADFLFFTDNSWAADRRAAIEQWPGIAITASLAAKAALPDKLRRIRLVTQPDFTRGEDVLKFGRSSGHTAISLAIAMGAERVVLLGYDMRIVAGRSHHHREYQTEDFKLFRDDFLVHFQGWNEAAERAGVRVINCTPGSALTEFPMASIDDILAEGADTDLALSSEGCADRTSSEGCADRPLPAIDPALVAFDFALAEWFAEHIRNSPISRATEAVNHLTAVMPKLRVGFASRLRA